MSKIRWFPIAACIITGLINYSFGVFRGIDYEKSISGRAADSLLQVVQKYEYAENVRHDLLTVVTARIDTIRRMGHIPDSSVVYQAAIELMRYHGWVTWSDLDSVLPYESGWGRDTRRGIFGEIRISQIDTNTQKQLLADLGLPTAPFDPEAYGNPVTATQYTVLYIALAKAIRGDFKNPYSRRYYFNGMHTTLPGLNTTRFDSVMSEIKRRKGGR